MLALIMPAINALFGSFLLPLFKAWTDYRNTQLKTEEGGFEAGAAADAKNIAIIANAEIQNNALKVQIYGSFTYRFISFWVGTVVALHFTLVFWDTILASRFLFGRPVLGVPDPPGQYPLYEWLIISSFFLVHAVSLGTSNVSQWLGRGK